MSTNSKKELIECERLIGIRIMQEDAESIYSLLQTEKNPIFTRRILNTGYNDFPTKPIAAEKLRST